MKEIKFFAMGGLGESGKNMYCVESGNDIFVFDCGHKLPPTNMFGVETIVADPRYLLDNKNKVRALIISHAHDDQMGGIVSFVDQFPSVKIYSTGIAFELIQKILKEQNKPTTHLVSFDPKRELKINGLILEFAVMAHNMIDNHIMFGKIGENTFVYATDFIFNSSQNKLFDTNVERIILLAKKYRPLFLMVSSLGSTIKTKISPNHLIGRYLEDDFQTHDGRIFVSLYEQDVNHIIEIVENARKTSRKVTIFGRELHWYFKYLIKRGVIKQEGLIIGKCVDIEKDTRGVTLIGGSGEMLFKKMINIGKGEDKYIKPRKTDKFINTAKALPGNETMLAKANNEIAKNGMLLKSLPFKEILPMQASVEELKELVTIIKPKYIIPIKGDFKAFKWFVDAISPLCHPKSIIVVENGKMLHFAEGKLAKKSKVEYSEKLTQSIGSRDIVEAVLDDRQRMAKNGLILIGAIVDKEGLASNIDIKIIGLNFEDEKEIHDQLTKMLVKEIAKNKDNPRQARNSIRSKIQRTLQKKINKQPQVLTILFDQ